jgi:hypothetical protein
MKVTKLAVLALASSIEFNQTPQALADGMALLAAAVAAAMPDDAPAPAEAAASLDTSESEAKPAAPVAVVVDPVPVPPAPAAPKSPSDIIREVASKLDDTDKVYATMLIEVADALDAKA